ncbi:phosphoribosylamine--glycine ligase [Atopobiaceae bacterium 24-176]
MDVLLLGAGGREHALLKAIQASPECGRVWVAPGNGGMTGADVAPIDENDPAHVAAFAVEKGVDLVVIGPEAPLVAGVADACRAAGVPVFGPSAAGAQLEGSKLFAKQVMERAGVPTAAYASFTEEGPALVYVEEHGAPLVVKADGLAAGKGVVVAQTTEEATEAVRSCFSGAFGDAGSCVVIEEMLTGPECSLLSVTDGACVVPLACAQDHKRALEGDCGPNTGGMGVYSPVPFVTPQEQAAMETVNEKVVRTLGAMGIPYQGVVYGGFMLTPSGPKVLEFNARFGDPETQVILPRFKGDMLRFLYAAATGTLDGSMVDWDDDWAVSVVLVSAGYPGAYEKGKVITGIEEAESLPGVTVYHAGTARTDDGTLVTAGGRVLDVTAVAPTFEEARQAAYAACDRIQFEGKSLRRDIGARALKGREAWEV